MRRMREWEGWIEEMDLAMTASDDELGLRRWSGMVGKNGMNPHMPEKVGISRVPPKAVI